MERNLEARGLRLEADELAVAQSQGRDREGERSVAQPIEGARGAQRIRKSYVTGAKGDASVSILHRVVFNIITIAL